MKLKVTLGIVGAVSVTDANKLVFSENDARKILRPNDIIKMQNAFDQHCESRHLTVTEALVATAGNILSIWRDEIEILEPEEERTPTGKQNKEREPIE